jgi:hypothetical protein
MSAMKRHWQAFRGDPPGSRFRLRYERRQRDRAGPVASLAWSVLAVTVMGLGIVLLPVWGLGIAVMLVGGAILSEESAPVARALDRLEAKLRGWHRHARNP